MNKTSSAIILRISFLILFTLDLGYSFYQHHHMPIGGDISHIVVPVPEKGYYNVLHDPFALDVLLRDKAYSTPNRFFAHWISSAYFRNTPLWLQVFTDPIESVYLSISFLKTLIQLLILYLLAVLITNRTYPFSLEFLLTVTLIYPLFQTSGYNRYIGIIDQSVIYTIFYALPLGLLLLFYLPFFRRLHFGMKRGFNIAIAMVTVGLALVLSLNGPLVTGVVLIASPLVILRLWILNFSRPGKGNTAQRIWQSFLEIPWYVRVFFGLFIIFCTYSLYVGKNDSMGMDQHIPLVERYMRLPVGLYYLLTSKLAYPLIFLTITINVILIRKFYFSGEADRMLTLFKWIGVFAILYILLLPLGGYRVYREYILRYDTFMPVTLCIFFIFGASTLFLFRKISGKGRLYYLSGITLLLLIFTNSDRPDTANYECEREALEAIARSNENVLLVEQDCPIMEWNILTDPQQRDLDADLLHLWKITDKKRLFYQTAAD